MTTSTMSRDDAGKAIRKRAMEGCPLARELLILRGMCSCQGDEKSVDDAEDRYLELAALQAECEKLRKDAERYRRLRIGDIDDIAVVRGLGAMDYGMSAVAYTYSEEIDGDDLDAAIDEAMEKENSND